MSNINDYTRTGLVGADEYLGRQSIVEKTKTDIKELEVKLAAKIELLELFDKNPDFKRVIEIMHQHGF